MRVYSRDESSVVLGYDDAQVRMPAIFCWCCLSAKEK